MPRKRKSRIYLKRDRWYGDFRDYADVGGQKEALIPTGARSATQDEAQAKELAADRLAELVRLRENGVKVEPGVDLTRLGDFTDHHLVREAELTSNTDEWIGQVDNHLRTAIEFFGSDIRLVDITTRRVTKYAVYLKTVPKWSRREEGDAKYGFIGPGSQRKYLNSLGKLFRYAISEGIVPQTHNPIAAMMEKPTTDWEEAEWLEVPDAALLLHAAKLYQPKRPGQALVCAYPLIATLLLSGGRRAEVLGLEIGDISLERKTITFRRRAARRLKTRGANRPVPMWPQLEAILREYLSGPNAPTGILLFPSTLGPNEPIRDIKRLLSELSVRVGRDGSIGTKVTRHTYCAARLQTLDHGFPVAEITVVRELGHDSTKMVREIYGHVGHIRHRAEVVEYRIEQHTDYLGSRVKDVEDRSWSRNSFGPNLKNRVPVEVEIAVIQIVAEMPNCGTGAVASQLAARGITVSRAGVGWIWKRHDLTTAAKRQKAVAEGRIAKVVAEVKEDRQAA